MPRSIKQIQEMLERKKVEVAALEAAALSAEAELVAKREARRLDHQATMLGRALLDQSASSDIKGLLRRLVDSFGPEDRARFDGDPVEPVRTSRKPKDADQAPTSGERTESPSTGSGGLRAA